MQIFPFLNKAKIGIEKIDICIEALVVTYRYLLVWIDRTG